MTAYQPWDYDLAVQNPYSPEWYQRPKPEGLESVCSEDSEMSTFPKAESGLSRRRGVVRPAQLQLAHPLKWVLNDDEPEYLAFVPKATSAPVQRQRRVSRRSKPASAGAESKRKFFTRSSSRVSNEWQDDPQPSGGCDIILSPQFKLGDPACYLNPLPFPSDMPSDSPVPAFPCNRSILTPHQVIKGWLVQIKPRETAKSRKSFVTKLLGGDNPAMTEEEVELVLTQHSLVESKPPSEGLDPFTSDQTKQASWILPFEMDRMGSPFSLSPPTSEGSVDSPSDRWTAPMNWDIPNPPPPPPAPRQDMRILLHTFTGEKENERLEIIATSRVFVTQAETKWHLTVTGQGGKWSFEACLANLLAWHSCIKDRIETLQQAERAFRYGSSRRLRRPSTKSSKAKSAAILGFAPFKIDTCPSDDSELDIETVTKLWLNATNLPPRKPGRALPPQRPVPKMALPKTPDESTSKAHLRRLRLVEELDKGK